VPGTAAAIAVCKEITMTRLTRSSVLTTLSAALLAFAALVPATARSANVRTVDMRACQNWSNGQTGSNQTFQFACGIPIGTDFFDANLSVVYFDFLTNANTASPELSITKWSYTGNFYTDTNHQFGLSSGVHDVAVTANLTKTNASVYDYLEANTTSVVSLYGVAAQTN
jgi:hypothetical protein